MSEEKKQKIKEYQKKYRKAYKPNIPEEKKQKIKEYQREYQKKYREAHKQKLKEYQKKYREAKKSLRIMNKIVYVLFLAIVLHYQYQIRSYCLIHFLIHFFLVLH